ncbi:unnamed protein product, partial [Meganyctiphanes norvegica]
MRRTWRWLMCAAGWVVATYMFFLVFVTLVSLTDPSAIKAYQAAHERTMVHGSWGITGKRSGRGARLPWCQPLKYRFPPGPSTALVSFPGSGNTWLRYLLQQ